MAGPAGIRCCAERCGDAGHGRLRIISSVKKEGAQSSGGPDDRLQLRQRPYYQEKLFGGTAGRALQKAGHSRDAEKPPAPTMSAGASQSTAFHRLPNRHRAHGKSETQLAKL